MKIGFTGTKQGMTNRQKRALRNLMQRFYRGCEFHHGDCVGADEQAHKIADKHNDSWTVQHPPDNNKARAFTETNEKRKPFPYLQRNHHIVTASEILIAAPRTLEEELRSGTWATVRYARKKGRPVIILDP